MIAQAMQDRDGTRYVQFEKLSGSMLFLEFLAEHGEARQHVRVYARPNGMMAAQVSGWVRYHYERCASYINSNT